MKKWIAAAVASATVVTLASATSSTTTASAATCAPASSKYIGGSIAGQDGRAINAQISLDVVDSKGRRIGMNGCLAKGYTRTLWVNTNVSGDGSTATTGVTRRWRLNNLPSNAVAVWIEVWTRTNQPKPCPTCDGPVDTHRYGFVNRRAVKVNNGSVRLLAPLHCAQGGSSGSIQGYTKLKNGTKVTLSRLYAWSMLTPDGSKPLQGWGAGKWSSGFYRVDNLASGQTYVVWATYNGVTQKRLNVPVRSCRSTPLSFAF